ncbi:uncharacterized protein OCT59_009155 [Rhizophagus irregularis]|uniref:uncharacterized protein n=1 Tax=Rhizophagus irregularis TaxID=588596 RepID=UPI00331F918C|nr:hypothetical protein OCT59_009155 [Rhizophagus irregularis]
MAFMVHLTTYIGNFYSIIKDPESNNFMMVMNHTTHGSLRQYLNNSFNSINWLEKLDILYKIAIGLADIHKCRLIHHDFYYSNVLKYNNDFVRIVNLGLYQSINTKPS